MANETQALRRQVNSDPRVRQLAESRRRGSMPGYVTAAELRGLGYAAVPDDWKYTSGNRDRGGRIQGGVFEEHDKWDTITSVAASAVPVIGATLPQPSPSASPSPTASPSGTPNYVPPSMVQPNAPTGITPPPGMAHVPTVPSRSGGTGFADWLRGQFTGLGLNDYLATGASIASMFGPGGAFNNPRTAGEEGLDRILGVAEGRIKASEPLFNELSGLAMDDAALARSRRASGEPILQALNAMAQQGMPDYTKRG